MKRSESLAHPPRSHLFTVRLWTEDVGQGQREMRMQVRHILSGELHYFRTWTELETFLTATLENFGSMDERGSPC